MTSFDSNLEMATFAGGCFWCIESAFAHLEGVKKVRSGFTGGDFPNPTYEDLHQKDTGHYEAVRVWFDPATITYERLLEIYWLQIDPTDPDGQFADRGPEYRTAIFYHNQAQKELAELSKKQLNESGKYEKKIVTEIKAANEFYEAEDYHQQYAQKYPSRYSAYRDGSGRAGYIEKTWGKNKPEFNFDKRTTSQSN